MLVGEAESAGVIEEEERRMIAGCCVSGTAGARADDAPHGCGLDRPRDDDETIRELLITTPHSRLPVSEGDADN